MIPWIKAANVPAEEHVAWLMELLEGADKKPGKWEMAVNNDRDRISIVQLRGNISLQSQLDRLVPTDDLQTWAKLIDRAADPVVAIMAPPNPSHRQFRRVLAKAIVNGQIKNTENGTLVFTLSTGEELNIGNNFEKAMAAIHHNWPELVFVESTFGRNLVVDEEKVNSQIKQLETILESASAPLRKLIDATAIKECQIQTELLLPRLRRIRKAIQKRILQ